MTYSDIYTKFLIEYDKQNITSSYPSLTIYETCTILDKAYLALIIQKITGNNTRKAAFGVDAKQTIDLQGLITNNTLTKESPISGLRIEHANEAAYYLYPQQDQEDPVEYKKLLYFVGGSVGNYQDHEPMVLISPEYAAKYGVTKHNDPIIRVPAFYIKDDILHLFYDRRTYPDGPNYVFINYIYEPEKFYDADSETGIREQEFQLNDAVAEELVNLAVIFALENVESQRTSSKITVSQMEG